METIRCEAPTFGPNGEIGQCNHAAIAEGRYCTCCEFMGGLIGPCEAARNLKIPHLHAEDEENEYMFFFLPNGARHKFNPEAN
jgi:hypothetical protein